MKHKLDSTEPDFSPNKRQRLEELTFSLQNSNSDEISNRFETAIQKNNIGFFINIEEIINSTDTTVELKDSLRSLLDHSLKNAVELEKVELVHCLAKHCPSQMSFDLLIHRANVKRNMNLAYALVSQTDFLVLSYQAALLARSIEMKHFDLAKLLLETDKVRPNSLNYLALQKACENRNFDFIQLLAECYERPRLSRKAIPAMVGACERGDDEVVKILLENNVNPCGKGNLPLVKAYSANRASTVELLFSVKKGVGRGFNYNRLILDNAERQQEVNEATVSLIKAQPQLIAKENASLFRQASQLENKALITTLIAKAHPISAPILFLLSYKNSRAATAEEADIEDTTPSMGL